jgi:MarR family transcriptional regulator, multiple antibiotic resistance protein MarR
MQVFWRLKQGHTKPRVESVFVGRLLLGRLWSALLEAHDEALEPLGLTARQGAVLMNCARGEANTPAELAAFNGLDVSSMSRMLDRLEKKQLVVRARSGKDRRQVVVKVTPKGQALLRRGVPVAARVAAKAWRNVTEEERKALHSIVYKILGNLGHLQKS